MTQCCAGRRVVRFFACLLLLIMLPLSAMAASAVKKGTVNTSSLRMRAAASTSAKTVTYLKSGTEVEILGTTGQWYKVRYKSFTGYVMSSYIKTGAASKTDYTGKPTVSTLKPGATGDNVRRLQTRLKKLKYYSGEITGKYDSATKIAVQTFQRKKGLYADGIVTKETMAKLYPASEFGGTPPKKLVTERLDWFAGHKYTIPKGAVVEIKDCRTGRVFKAKRWSGGNHMDTEPLTRDDTAIMLSIYGGKWSWNRRPILVKYKDHVYAASMNGMPHEQNTIRSNNFSGHFCIHFYGSKTHGSKRVDPDHRRCEAQAMKYKW